MLLRNKTLLHTILFTCFAVVCRAEALVETVNKRLFISTTSSYLQQINFTDSFSLSNQLNTTLTVGAKLTKNIACEVGLCNFIGPSNKNKFKQSDLFLTEEIISQEEHHKAKLAATGTCLGLSVMTNNILQYWQLLLKARISKIKTKLLTTHVSSLYSSSLPEAVIDFKDQLENVIFVPTVSLGISYHNSKSYRYSVFINLHDFTKSIDLKSTLTNRATYIRPAISLGLGLQLFV